MYADPNVACFTSRLRSQGVMSLYQKTYQWNICTTKKLVKYVKTGLWRETSVKSVGWTQNISQLFKKIFVKVDHFFMNYMRKWTIHTAFRKNYVEVWTGFSTPKLVSKVIKLLGISSLRILYKLGIAFGHSSWKKETRKRISSGFIFHNVDLKVLYSQEHS